MIDTNWPVGKVATKIILFTRRPNEFLVNLLKMFHETVDVINPDEMLELAEKYSIEVLPTIIFIWNETEIKRLEITNITE